jgi:hypothetical protein
MGPLGLGVVHPIAPFFRQPTSAAEDARQHAESHGSPDGENNDTSDAQCSQHRDLKVRLLPFSLGRKNVASVV